MIPIGVASAESEPRKVGVHVSADRKVGDLIKIGNVPYVIREMLGLSSKGEQYALVERKPAKRVDFVETDGGRRLATGYGHAKDCVTRALAEFTGKSYTDCYNEVCQVQKDVHDVANDANVRPDRSVTHHAAALVYSRNGLKELRLWQCIIVSDAYRRFGDCIVRTGGKSAGHAICVKDGAARDSWDSRSRWVDTVFVPEDRFDDLLAQENSRDRLEVNER